MMDMGVMEIFSKSGLRRVRQSHGTGMSREVYLFLSSPDPISVQEPGGLSPIITFTQEAHVEQTQLIRDASSGARCWVTRS